MRTIEKILNLHKTNLIELESLELNGYINWIGWEWFNLDRYVRELVYQFYNFDELRAEKLFKDLRICWLLHDRNFLFKKWFIYSNYLLWRDIFLLIRKWAWFWNAFSLWLGIFILTSLYGKKYYFK